ncbi:nucleoside/nucleotide kinase family protein [Terriglobus albidus]|uniref:thymidylate kinase n=1 Tax=Terriglobus albidus TaxID=1592106 RepID=UPI0021E097CF|nr:thymidylate kinase [Terriglobus albidus]
MKRILPEKRPLLISFSGIDGAGKSTQIALLRDVLRLSGQQVQVVTFWDDVVALKSFREDVGHKVFKGDRGVGSPEAPIHRRDKNVQSPMLSCIRMALYALDLLSLRRTVKKLVRAAEDRVVIFDRFLYDELANLRLDRPLQRLYVHAILRFVPKPDLAFVLDADPDAAFARKPEYPLQFLRSNRMAYLRLAEIAGMTVIPPSNAEHAHCEICRHVEEKKHALLSEGKSGHESHGDERLFSGPVSTST